MAAIGRAGSGRGGWGRFYRGVYALSADLRGKSWLALMTGGVRIVGAERANFFGADHERSLDA